MLEPESVRPQIERACLARHPIRHIVHLAEPRRVKTIFLEHGTDRAGALWYERIVPGIAGGKLRDVSTGDGVMVSSGDQRGPRRRAQRGRVIHVVTKAIVSDALEIRGLDRSAKRAARTEAYVVR